MKKRLKQAALWLAIGSIYTLPFIAGKSHGAFDAFYKIDTIPGESTDHKHENWIQILAFNHGVINPVSRDPATGQLRRDGDPVVDKDVVVTKFVDKSSPILFLQAVDGQSMAEHKISFAQTGTGPNSDTTVQYFEVTMSNVFVKSYSISGSTNAADEKPVEEITFAYDKIQWTYTELDGTKTSAGHDFARPQQ